MVPNYFTTPIYHLPSSSSDTSTGIIVVAAIVPTFILFICLAACARSAKQQRSNFSSVTTNNQRVVRQYPQQPTRGSIQVLDVRSFSNVRSTSPLPPVPSICEASPPSYEVANANVSSRHQSEPPPYVITMNEQTNSEV